MAISEKTILDPEAAKPGIPLRKSTLAVILLLVLALGFLSALIFSGSRSTDLAAGPILKDASGLKKIGSDQMLSDEEADAAKKLKKAAPVPIPPGMPPLPPSVRREDNTSALFDNKEPPRSIQPPQGRDKDLEREAQTRMAKAVVADFDAPHEDKGAAVTGRDTPRPGGAQAGSGSSSSSARQESAVKDQIDAFRKQLQAGAAGAASPARAKEDWVREYAQESAGQRGVNKGYQATRRLVLRQGKVIPAVLGRQINSDLPGRITAYVSSDVYDPDGLLLIPKGSALVGKYDSGVQVGQTRLMFAFERLILPSGYSFDLPAAPGADLAGAAGMTGDVDNHFLKMFGTSLLIAVLSDNTKQPSSVTQIGGGPVLTAAGQVLSDVSKTILERNRVIAPTITVDQGTRINVEVASDMVFPEAYPLP
jgi:type IV secretion system protein VirB10